MTWFSKIAVFVGCVFILLAGVSRTICPIVIGTSGVKPSSFLILTNICFVVALLCKSDSKKTKE